MTTCRGRVFEESPLMTPARACRRRSASGRRSARPRRPPGTDARGPGGSRALSTRACAAADSSASRPRSRAGRADLVAAAVEVQHHPLARHPGCDHPLGRNAIRVRTDRPACPSGGGARADPISARRSWSVRVPRPALPTSSSTVLSCSLAIWRPPSAAPPDILTAQDPPGNRINTRCQPRPARRWRASSATTDPILKHPQSPPQTQSGPLPSPTGNPQPGQPAGLQPGPPARSPPDPPRQTPTRPAPGSPPDPDRRQTPT